MKYLSVILLLLSVAVVAGAQVGELTITAPAWVTSGKYLVVYLEDVYKPYAETYINCVGGSSLTTTEGRPLIGSVVVGHEVKCKLFDTLGDILNWLNSGNITYYPIGEDQRKDVRLDREHLIAIYDLSTAHRLQLELKTEEVVKPKRVEIEEERWTNQEWRVK